MEPELQQKLEEQDKKLDAIFKSAEKTRRYFLWVLIISVAMIILPLIGVAIIIPRIIDLYTGALGL